MPSIKFQLNQTRGLGDVVEEFQDGHCGHLGYWHETIFIILNFHVATMPPTKFQFNPTYGSGGDVKNVKN